MPIRSDRRRSIDAARSRTAFARSALELALDLKAGGGDAQAFAGAVHAVAPERRARAEYLGRLLLAYEARMASLGLADREDELRGACAALEQGLPAPLKGFGVIELCGIHDFSPRRRQLLGASNV